MTKAARSAPAIALEELPLMLTVEEAARVLRIGRNGAYAAVADGSLPSVRIGRRIRIPRDCLAALFDIGPTVGRSAGHGLAATLSGSSRPDPRSG